MQRRPRSARCARGGAHINASIGGFRKSRPRQVLGKNGRLKPVSPENCLARRAYRILGIMATSCALHVALSTGPYSVSEFRLLV